MELTVKNWDNFDHARWRVQFLRSLVQMHQTVPQRGSKTWKQEEVEYAQRLATAEKELQRFPEEWHTLPQSRIPRRSVAGQVPGCVARLHTKHPASHGPHHDGDEDDKE